MERQHVRALAQYPVHEILQYRCIAFGALALAMDHAHAAMVMRMRFREEPA